MNLSDICNRLLVPTFDYYMTNKWREGVKAGENFHDALANVAMEVTQNHNDTYEYTELVSYCLDQDDELLATIISMYLRKISQLDNLKLYIQNVTDLDSFRTLITHDIL